MLRVALLAVFLLGYPVTAAAQAPAPKPRDSFAGPDKLKHFLLSGFIEAVTFTALQSTGTGRSTARVSAIAAVSVASLGREVHDRKTKGLFSFGDLVWDALGASAALILINKTQK